MITILEQRHAPIPPTNRPINKTEKRNQRSNTSAIKIARSIQPNNSDIARKHSTRINTDHSSTKSKGKREKDNENGSTRTNKGNSSNTSKENRERETHRQRKQKIRNTNRKKKRKNGGKSKNARAPDSQKSLLIPKVDIGDQLLVVVVLARLAVQPVLARTKYPTPIPSTAKAYVQAARPLRQ